jgi:hypothetical protein
MKVMVEQKGLRAQLQLESVVTGQLFIQLAFHAEVPPQRVVIDPLTNLPEIPTIPTTLQEVQAALHKALVKIGEWPLEQIATSLNGTLQGIDRLVNAPEVTRFLGEPGGEASLAALWGSGIHVMLARKRSLSQARDSGFLCETAQEEHYLDSATGNPGG